jgi:hypothetical protein
VILKLFVSLDILGNVNLMHRISRQQRLVLGASMIALTIALPAAFGLDLITNTQDQEQVVEATPTPEAPMPTPEEVVPTVEPTPEASPVVTSDASPTPSEPTVEPSEKPTPEPKPVPVHALANQSIYLIAPKQVSVDPRATTTTLPAITVGSSETLLLCAFSDKAIFHVPYIPYIPVAIDPKKPELGSRNSFLIQGQGTSHLRISGPSYAVMSAFNGGNGMRITSSSRAISGGQILLRFINMSEPTLDGSFCGEGNVGNNRSISIRALGIDLQMVKSDVNLKRNK